jgi:hypothetical protein
MEAVSKPSLSGTQKAIAGSAGLTLIAAFMPWATELGITTSGMAGGGRLTAVLALVTLGALVSHLGIVQVPRASQRMFEGISLGCAGLTMVIALMNLSSLGSSDSEIPGLEATAGYGLILTLLTGLAWAGVTGLGIRSRLAST